MPDSIFDSALLSMCMTWRHDFGFLDRKEQMAIRGELLGLYEHHVKPVLDRASSAESGLAAMRQRAERAESCLLRVQRLADDGVDDPAGPHNVLAQIANTVEAALSSPRADASKMVGERERRLAETLRHVCKHLCQWKDACETGCIVSAALADMEQKS